MVVERFFRRVLSCSYAHLFSPGVANARLLIFLYVSITLFATLPPYLYCVAMSSLEPLESVELRSGQSFEILGMSRQQVGIISVSRQEYWFHMDVEYRSHTNGELDAAERETLMLLNALEERSAVPHDTEYITFKAWYKAIEFPAFLGFNGDCSCRYETIVIYERDENEQWTIPEGGMMFRVF